MAKLPPTAFSEYVSMGAARSYEAIAKRHGCSKKAVTKRGTKEHWQDRIA